MSSRDDIPPVALTIAGFDPSGGAGVIADVRTFAAFGCFPAAAVTSLTFQNTVSVSGALHQAGAAVRAQILPVIEDFTIAAVKTGMLPTRDVVLAVAAVFREYGLPAPVVDPVIRSTSGHPLVEQDALGAMVEAMFPIARLVTPNIPEAEVLAGLRIGDEESMRRAAASIRQTGARAVLIKGGHLEGDALDVLDDEGRVTEFRSERIPRGPTHGTGCILSAAIAACLADGSSLEDAIARAKRFVAEAIRRAPPLGRGASPVWPGFGIDAH